METPLVSVVIPSYNHACYITQAITSVLTQGYPKVELIVIDDGSTDESPAIIASLARQHGFRFVQQSNHGVSHALNHAIRNYSTGEYIAVLASDDYMHPEKIQKQIACLRQLPHSQLCFTQAVEFDTEQKRPLRIFPQRNFQGDMLKRIFLRQPYAAGSILFTRSLFEKLNGYDENIRLEDWDFLIRAAAQTHFSGVYQPLCYYRSHPLNTFKTISRREIYKEKKQLLLKNRHLVSPLILARSLLAHYVYDHWLHRVKWLDLRGMLH